MNYSPLSLISLVVAFVPVFAGFSRIKFIRREYLIFFFFIIVGAITEIVSFILSIQRINNHWVAQIYDLLEYILVMLVLSTWQKDSKTRYYFRLTIPVYVLFWVISKFTFEQLNGIGNYTHTFSVVAFIIASVSSLIYFVTEEQGHLIREARFWIACGLLLFFCGNFMFYLLIKDFISLNPQDAMNIMYFRWSFSIAINIIFTMSLLLIKRC